MDLYVFFNKYVKKYNVIVINITHNLSDLEEKQYEKELIARGIERKRIRKYGFAFLGKEVLIGEKE